MQRLFHDNRTNFHEKHDYPVMEVHRLALTFGEKPVEYRISTINTQAHDYVSVLSQKA
ncbi:MAG: hypothetical protein ACREXR_23945 [Gammaproteobacteria bacterium]